MRINKVEELVGITKKNIRFYEEKGLLTPARNAENGYREYSEEDIVVLQKIKLFRQLSIPIEEILKLQQGYLTLEDCMRRHIIALDREEENVKQYTPKKSAPTHVTTSIPRLDALLNEDVDSNYDLDDILASLDRRG